MTPPGLDERKLKEMAIALWREEGMDTLLQVVPLGPAADKDTTIGYCISA